MGHPPLERNAVKFNPKTEVESRCDRSAGFPACGFWRLSSRQFPHGNTGLESPVNPPTGRSALQHLASAVPLAILVYWFKLPLIWIFHTTARRVRARGLQAYISPLVGRVSSRGVLSSIRSQCEISGLEVIPFGNSKLESQRDSGAKPRVAGNELPWENADSSTLVSPVNSRTALGPGVATLVAGLLLLLTFPAASPAQTNEQRSLVLVIGAAGEPEYGEQFSHWADLWKQAAAKGGFHAFVIGEDADHPTNDRTRLLTVLTNEVAKPGGELWLVFLGPRHV